MDKLRALEYFVAAAHTNSFSAAARRMEVSVNAVAKLIGALETSLGARLFERYAHGLVLTANGSRYLDACEGVLAQMSGADELIKSSTVHSRGTVVVGAQHVIAQAALAEALPRFNELYPDIRLDLREFLQVTDHQIGGVDVLLVLGWPRAEELVQRTIGTCRFVVCATPAYWSKHGVPQHPSELAHHNCLTIRGNVGTLLDLWPFRRADESVSVPVAGWLLADNVHRDVLMRLAVAGCGVIRTIDWASRKELASGALVPVLIDWEPSEVPPVNLLYRPGVRRTPRVRLFIEFVTGLFREIEAERKHALSASAPPRWVKRPYTRASSSISREK